MRARDDHVGLLLLAVAMTEVRPEARRVVPQADAEVARIQVPATEPPLDAVNSPLAVLSRSSRLM
jgi:hypothetical protein